MQAFLVLLVAVAAVAAQTPSQVGNGVLSSLPKPSVTIPVQLQGSNSITSLNLNQLPRMPTSLKDLEEMLQKMGYTIPVGAQLNIPGIMMPNQEQLQQSPSSQPNPMNNQVNQPGTQPGNQQNQNMNQNQGGYPSNPTSGTQSESGFASFLRPISSIIPSGWSNGMLGNPSKPGTFNSILSALANTNSKINAAMKARGMSPEQIRAAFEKLATRLKELYSMDASKLPAGQTRAQAIEDVVNKFVDQNGLTEVKQDLGNMVQQFAQASTAGTPFQGAQQSFQNLVNQNGMAGAVDTVSGNANLALNQAYDVMNRAFEQLKRLAANWLNQMGMTEQANQVLNMRLPAPGSFSMSDIQNAIKTLTNMATSAMQFMTAGNPAGLVQAAIQQAFANMGGRPGMGYGQNGMQGGMGSGFGANGMQGGMGGIMGGQGPYGGYMNRPQGFLSRPQGFLNGAQGYIQGMSPQGVYGAAQNAANGMFGSMPAPLNGAINQLGSITQGGMPNFQSMAQGGMSQLSSLAQGGMSQLSSMAQGIRNPFSNAIAFLG